MRGNYLPRAKGRFSPLQPEIPSFRVYTCSKPALIRPSAAAREEVPLAQTTITGCALCLVSSPKVLFLMSVLNTLKDVEICPLRNSSRARTSTTTASSLLIRRVASPRVISLTLEKRVLKVVTITAISNATHARLRTGCALMNGIISCMGCSNSRQLGENSRLESIPARCGKYSQYASPNATNCGISRKINTHLSHLLIHTLP